MQLETIETDTTIEFKKPQPRQYEPWTLRQYFYSIFLAMKILIETEDASAEGKLLAPLHIEKISEIVMKKIHPSAKNSGSVSDSRNVALHNMVAQIMQNYYAMFIAKTHHVDDDGVPLEAYDPRKSYATYVRQFDSILAMPVPSDFAARRAEFAVRAEELRKYSTELGLILTIEDDLQVRLKFTYLWDELRNFLAEIDEFEAVLKKKQLEEKKQREQQRDDAARKEVDEAIDELCKGTMATKFEEAQKTLVGELNELIKDD